MGALLDKPKTEKYNEHGDWNGLRYGLAAMQGWRIEMEDAHCAVMGLPGTLKDWAFFAVFDGHAGEKVSFNRGLRFVLFPAHRNRVCSYMFVAGKVEK